MKSEYKSIFLAMLRKGVLVGGESPMDFAVPCVPGSVPMSESGLTFEQHRDLMILQCEHEKIKLHRATHGRLH